MSALIIKSPRLVLREYQSSDWAACQIYTQRADILQYEIWGPNSPEETKYFIAKAMEDQATAPRYIYELAVTLAETGELIGGCGCRIHPEEPQRCDIGYIINPAYWKQGYATEAAQAIIAYATQYWGIQIVEATCDDRNLASQRVLEKVGLQFKRAVQTNQWVKGRFRRYFFYENTIIEV